MDDVRWVRRGLILVPDLPEPKPRGAKPKPTFYEWDTSSMRQAHACFVAGERSVWSREGERMYQRNAKRGQRSRLSAVDRVWCEKSAVEWSWSVDERTNRRARVANII